MKHIRPYELFEKLESKDREVTYHIPEYASRVTESLLSVETMVLIAIARLAKVKNILELGTAYGYTALHLAMNLDALITTVDKNSDAGIAYKETCHDLRYSVNGHIQTVTQDITSLKTLNAYDMVFCDCNYTPELFDRATAIAIAAKPKVIAWHDYQNPMYPWLRDKLERMMLGLVHVESTWLVIDSGVLR